MERLTLDNAKNLVKMLVQKKKFSESEETLYRKLLWAFVELGEAADAFKKGEDWYDIAEELVDTIFYILDFINLVEKTQKIKINLDDLFLKKWKKNMARNYNYLDQKNMTNAENINQSLNQITIEINKKCFNECVHCSAYVSGDDVKKILSFEKIKEIIDSFVILGGEEINISGGEPLLHPNIFEILSYAKSQKIRVNLFTCGIYSNNFSKQLIEKVVKKIEKSSVDELMITLHASYEEMHDQITKIEGTFNQTISFIKELLRRNQNVSIHFVPMQINSEDIEEVIDFLINLKVEKLQILRFIPQGRGLENRDWLSLKKDAFLHLLKKSLKFSDNKEIQINLGHPSDFRFLLNSIIQPKPCTAGTEQCMIDVNGNVIPCPAFGDLTQWIAGNIFQSNLSNIWTKSELFDQLRKFKYQKIQGACKECEFLYLCKGRCPAERIRQNGALYQGPDPLCPKQLI